MRGAARAWSTLKGLLRNRPVPMWASPRVRGLKTPRPHGRHAKPPQAGQTLALAITGGRATSCGNGASRGQNAAKDVLGVRKLLT